VRRPPIPAFIGDLFVDRGARDALLAGSVALFAAALDPKVWGPSLPTVQAAVRDHPQLETIVLLAAVSGSALLLLGGAIGDTSRARPIILGGLAIELLASLAGLLVPDGALFVVTRFIGHASAAFVIPVSIALVATSYTGVARATAIGLAYGAYGAAGAAAPILLQIIPDSRAPAFVAAIAASAVAIWLARTRVSELARPSRAERPYVVGTAIWAFGAITLTVGITWFGSGLDNPVRWALIVGGLLVLALAGVYDRRRRAHATEPVRIERRPVAIAIFVGVVIAVSQTAAMLELPLYFHLILGYGPVVAMVALAPLFGALVLAGPAAGFLISRVSPRLLVGGGVLAVGAGNLLLALITTDSTPYLGFIVPCLLIGAGFVVATTVRTAIIFASVPRGLPATAAALNEASISVGMRIGIVLVTTLVTEVALSTFSASVSGLPADEATRSVAAFRDVLVAIGTPAFAEIATAVGQADVQPYVDAYATGVRAAFLFSGVAAVVGGLVALVALGRRDPLATVWDHGDERAAAAS
jgi:MFS family permease